jgi:molybdopterin-containing oxidoreductase family iron-sulfur binding subunit
MNREKDLETKLEAICERLGDSREMHCWRSLEELVDSEAFGELVREEFPEHAARWPEVLGRRKFLALMGASLALAGLGGCSVNPAPQIELVPYSHPPEGLVPGKPLFFATAMTHAGRAVGLLVESQMGRPIKIEGNPDHPASLGATDIFHQASVLTLYDPDRAKTPTYLGQTRTWGEAEAAIRQAIEKQRGKRGAGFRLLTESVVSPTLAQQLEDFFKDFPEAKWHAWEPIHHDSAWHAAQIALGEPVTPIYDFSKADVVLSLDADIFGPAEGNIRYAAQFMDRRRVRTGDKDADQARMNRLYVVETAVTCTGAKADHRLALRAQDIEGVARAIAARLGVDAGGEVAEPLRTGEEISVAFRSAKGFPFRGAQGDNPTVIDSPVLSPWIRAVVDDLGRHRGRSLVLAGMGQPPAVHILAHVLNDRLGNVGNTVRYIAPIDARPGDRTQSLRELTEDMAQGKVEFLLILGGNPAYNAPADLPFAENLEKLTAREGSLVVRHGLYQDETSYQCQWHLPEAHYLEAWSDARAYDGTESLVQPLIEPLYQGRSAHEVVALVAKQLESPGREIVRSYWRTRWKEGGKGKADAADDFETFWATALQEGVIPNTASEPKMVRLKGDWQEHLSGSPLPLGEGQGVRAGGAGSPVEISAPLPPSLEIVFQPDPSIFDGCFANNAWLQELPKPITKLTWGNAALMSPATARQLGVALGGYLHGGEHGGYDVPVVDLQLGERMVRAPIWIMPGHADGSVTVSLGFGQEHAGKLGGTVKQGVGFNAYRLRTADHPWFAPGLTVTKTGRTERAVCTQNHHTMADREVVRAGTLAEYKEDPRFAAAREKEHQKEETRRVPPPITMYDAFDYSPPKNKWGMLIDLTTCIGCNACIVACQAENNIPVVGKDQVAAGREMHWIRVDRYISGTPDVPEGFHFQPVPCMHCEKAPCEYVCPVEATVHSAEGLNDMVYNRCVGTRFCSNNCPYKVRRFNFFHFADDTTPSRRLQYNPEVTVRSRGVMEKCTYCVQRIRQAEIDALKQDRRIADGEVLTACQAACPTQAITFGDINDPGSKVKRWKDAPLHYALLADLNTEPRTTYLAELRNPNPELPEQES